MMRLKHESTETAQVVEALGQGDLGLEKLEFARAADRAWRSERRAEAEQRVARFSRWVQWSIGIVLLGTMVIWRACAATALTVPGMHLFGWVPSHIEVDCVGLVFSGILTGLWTQQAYQWLDRRKAELAGLAPEPAAFDACSPPPTA